MDRYELLGLLLQNLRDDHGPDEEDLDAAVLRETTKIYELVIRHGHLTRDMFDLTGIENADGVGEPYSSYQTTNYPITFVVFADRFADWLKGDDQRERLELIDLIVMIKEFSWMDIKVIRRPHSYLVRVREGISDYEDFNERVSIPRRSGG